MASSAMKKMDLIGEEFFFNGKNDNNIDKIHFQPHFVKAKGN
jgi:hypothetical protein